MSLSEIIQAKGTQYHPHRLLNIRQGDRRWVSLIAYDRKHCQLFCLCIRMPGASSGVPMNLMPAASSTDLTVKFTAPSIWSLRPAIEAQVEGGS
jgi:hypothetical protein